MSQTEKQLAVEAAARWDTWAAEGKRADRAIAARRFNSFRLHFQHRQGPRLNLP